MSPLLAGGLALGLIAIVCYFVFTKANPFANPFELRAAFTQIPEVRPGSPVRIAGINVGKVTGTEPGPNPRSSILTMELREEALPVRADARMKVRARIFLEGSVFVDLQPGSPSAPELDENAVVPATQTDTHVPVGEVLKIFSQNTREDFRTVVDELGTAFSGGGAEAFNRTTKYYEQVFRDGSQLNEAARGESGEDLSVYLRESAKVSGGLARNTDRLQDLVTNVATAAGALARESDALGRTIDELPKTLTQGRATLARVNDALPNLRLFARTMTPVLQRSPATLDAAYPFVRQLRLLIRREELGGMARDVGRLAPPLAKFTRGSIKLQGQQRLVASCQNNQILPTTRSTIQDERFPASGPVFQEFVKWFPGVAGGGRNFDANTLYSRTFAPSGNFIYPLGNERFFYNTQPIRGINPAPSPLPPFRPDVPCETQERPDLRSNPMNPPAEINALPSLDLPELPEVPPLPVLRADGIDGIEGINDAEEESR